MYKRLVLCISICLILYLSVASAQEGYIAYYSFDQGTAKDDSGNGADGTIYGSPTIIDGISKTSKALQFNGEGDYIKIPRMIQDDFTIVFWVKTTQTAGEGHWYRGNGLVDAETCNVVDDFGTALLGSKASMGIGNPDTTSSSQTEINDGQWHQIVAVREKSTGAMRLYVNGTLAASGTGNKNSLTAPEWIVIGNNPCDVSHNRWWFKGAIDGLKIYNRALVVADRIDSSHNYLDIIKGIGIGPTVANPEELVLVVVVTPSPLVKAMGAKFVYIDAQDGKVKRKLKEQKMQYKNGEPDTNIFDFHVEIPTNKKYIIKLFWFDGNKWYPVHPGYYTGPDCNGPYSPDAHDRLPRKLEEYARRGGGE